MSLIVICGIPRSGKSTIADMLRDLIEAQGRAVRVIRDGDAAISVSGSQLTQSLGEEEGEQPRRQDMYGSFRAEKQTRAQLRANSERALCVPGQVVVVDSLNYIKGFRYELFCLAKTANVGYAVVHADTPPAICAERDVGGDIWGDALRTALSKRFEKPIGRNRWDSPLFSVDTTQVQWEAELDAVVSAVLGGRGRLAATMATRVVPAPTADALADIDRVTRAAEAVVVSRLQGGAAVGDAVLIPEASLPVRLQRKPRIAELRDMRRSFLNYSRMHPPQGKSLVDEYVHYINEQLTVVR